jgi:hypothetical protein
LLSRQDHCIEKYLSCQEEKYQPAVRIFF